MAKNRLRSVYSGIAKTLPLKAGDDLLSVRVIPGKFHKIKNGTVSRCQRTLFVKRERKMFFSYRVKRTTMDPDEMFR